MNIIETMQYFPTLLVVSILAGTVLMAQTNPDDFNPENKMEATLSAPMAYLRIANLIGIKNNRIDITLNNQQLRANLDPGFINQYTPTESGKWSISVLDSKTKSILTTAILDGVKKDEYATLVIFKKNVKTEALLLKDVVPSNSPPQRVRVFVGATVPKLTLDISPLAKWDRFEIPFQTNITNITTYPSMATATYVDRNQEVVVIQYPFDAKHYSANSVFIFDTGSGRADVRVLPDNAVPTDMPEEN